MSAPFVRVTDARQLRDRVCELLASDVSMEQCRDAMHGLGLTRYESLDGDDLVAIADAVVAEATRRFEAATDTVFVVVSEWTDGENLVEGVFKTRESAETCVKECTAQYIEMGRTPYVSPDGTENDPWDFDVVFGEQRLLP